jgi:hypothetical protein
MAVVGSTRAVSIVVFGVVQGLLTRSESRCTGWNCFPPSSATPLFRSDSSPMISRFLISVLKTLVAPGHVIIAHQ